MRYFLYARKSTDVEDKQVLSIEAQLSELRALARKEGLEVVQEFVEKRSAKNSSPPIFPTSSPCSCFQANGHGILRSVWK
jgi:DNA invertase Pin-like site-specific DNA recombinase